MSLRRDLAFGIGAAGFLLWVTFFADAGLVVIATMATAAAALVWFATVEPERLLDGRMRPNMMLFLLAFVGLALLVTASAMLVSATTLLTALIGISAVATGLVRAVRAGLEGNADKRH